MGPAGRAGMDTAMEQVSDTTSQGSSAGQISVEARVSDLVRLGIIGLFAYWTLELIAPFALIVIWSAILAVALFPMFDALSRLIGNRPVISAFVIVVSCLVMRVIISLLSRGRPQHRQRTTGASSNW